MFTKLKPASSVPAPEGVIRDADGAFIPADPDNIDWQTYQAWLNAGNLPTDPPADPPTAVASPSSRA